MSTTVHLIITIGVVVYATRRHHRLGPALGYALLIDSGIDAIVDIPKAATTGNLAWLAAELGWLGAAIWAAHRITRTPHPRRGLLGTWLADATQTMADTARITADIDRLDAETAELRADNTRTALRISIMHAVNAHPDRGLFLSDMIAFDVAATTNTPIDVVLDVIAEMRGITLSRLGLTDGDVAPLFGLNRPAN